ncbi:MAG: metallophosphoesterase family protein [Gilvibacter sp.]
MKNYYAIALATFLIGSSCSEEIAQEKADPIVFSFAFTGCNRVGFDVHQSSNPSTANHVALDSIVLDMINQEITPDLFFNLGDIVRAEQTDTIDLATQLNAWVGLETVKKLDSSGIKMVAVPGNHELLQSVEGPPKVYHEYPLEYSTDVFLEYMQDHLPKGRDTAPNALNLDNRLTFSFIKDSIGFVVINTDTYNPPATGKTYGEEGKFPINWINQKIVALNKDPGVKHVFALGHRPYFVNGQVPAGNHDGLPNAKSFWDTMSANNVVAYLAAHKHDYQRYQPNNAKTTQVTAGNAGSPNGAASFFGYSLINIYKSGKIQLISRGYCVPNDYLKPNLASRMKVRDSTFLKWTGNSNPISPYSVPCND